MENSAKHKPTQVYIRLCFGRVLAQKASKALEYLRLASFSASNRHQTFTSYPFLATNIIYGQFFKNQTKHSDNIQ